MKNNWFYTVYAIILAIISIYTGEIVTFVMLSLILLALININTTLKENKYDKRSKHTNNKD